MDKSIQCCHFPCWSGSWTFSFLGPITGLQVWTISFRVVLGCLEVVLWILGCLWTDFVGFQGFGELILGLWRALGVFIGEFRGLRSV